MTSRANKFALLIDGPNLYAAAKTLGFDIDYKRLLTEFQSRGTLLRAFHYTTMIEDQEYSSRRPLIDWLDYNGYTVVRCHVRPAPPPASNPNPLQLAPPASQPKISDRLGQPPAQSDTAQPASLT